MKYAKKSLSRGLGLAIFVGFTFPCQAKVTLENLKTEPLDNYGASLAPSSQWTTNNPIPNSSSGVGLDAHTGINGYVILNKDQGLIKQWGRINLPANSLGQHRVSFPKRMSNVFTINVSSSDPYTSSGCRNCVIETGARVKNYNSSGFNITNGFVGDGKGGVYAVTLYWEATGTL